MNVYLKNSRARKVKGSGVILSSNHPAAWRGSFGNAELAQ